MDVQRALVFMYFTLNPHRPLDFTCFSWILMGLWSYMLFVDAHRALVVIKKFTTPYDVSLL